MTPTPRLDSIRFAPERALIDLLFERYGLEDVLRRYLDSGEAAPYYELMVSSQVRLTPILSPRLTGLLDEVRATLGVDAPTELFVEPSAEINAFALHGLSPDKPHVVSVTAGLVERMTDPEIRFVLGHEVGHLYFRHYRSRLVQVALAGEQEDETKVPPLLARRLETWDRLAELSADRAGFTAVGGDLGAIVSSFFKMASGLGPEHLRFDLHAFLQQLEDIQRLERRDVLARFSHPVTPVRVRALQLFGEAGGAGATEEALRAVDARVAEVARLMDLEVTEPLEVHFRDVLLAGSLLAAHAGGGPIRPDQAQILYHALLPLCSDPEERVASVKSPAQARQMLGASADWLAANAGQERFAAFMQVAHVATADGTLDPAEEAFMLEMAARLQIPDKTAQQMLYEVVTSYLQSKATARTPAFAFEADKALPEWSVEEPPGSLTRS